MFSSIFMYDLTDSTYNPWRLLLLTGATLFLTAVLVFIMPELVAYLIAIILVWLAILSFAMGVRLRRAGRRPMRYKDFF